MQWVVHSWSLPQCLPKNRHAYFWLLSPAGCTVNRDCRYLVTHWRISKWRGGGYLVRDDQFGCVEGWRDFIEWYILPRFFLFLGSVLLIVLFISFLQCIRLLSDYPKGSNPSMFLVLCDCITRVVPCVLVFRYPFFLYLFAYVSLDSTTVFFKSPTLFWTASPPYNTSLPVFHSAHFRPGHQVWW